MPPKQGKTQKRKKNKDSPGLQDSEVKRPATTMTQNVGGAYNRNVPDNSGQSHIGQNQASGGQNQASGGYIMQSSFPYNNTQTFNSPGPVFYPNDNAASPVLQSSQQQHTQAHKQHQVGQNLDPNNELTSKLDFIMSKVTKIDSIEMKMSKLDDIEKQQTNILSRLSQIELTVNANKESISHTVAKLKELEQSQVFLSSNHDDFDTKVIQSEATMKKVQGDLKSISQDNEKLKRENNDLFEEVLDIKCRSMRDNMVFVGIPEFTNIPSGNVRGESSETNQGNAMDVTSGVGDENTVHEANRFENCVKKVLDFCKNTLKIINPEDKINIDRAHRLGRRIYGRTRSIVVKFKDTDSKFVVKGALRDVNLKHTPYAVYDQFPAEIQERRKALYPVMIQARRDNKRAVMVRDKLFIDNQLYKPNSQV